MGEKNKFKKAAKKILHPSSRPTTMEEFMDSDTTGQGESSQIQEPGTPESRETVTKTPKTKPVVDETPEVVHVRHEVRIDEDLSEQMRLFVFMQKTDKTKFMKSLLLDFFSKSENQRIKILEAGLKKIK
jgi:hypothetical protein